MPWHTLIDVPDLIPLAEQADVRLVDCRFDLHNPPWGRAEYLRAHIPGAGYADLDTDLSGARTGVNGRHPLPAPEDLRGTLGRLGIDSRQQVIAYDQDSGMFASRLWWLLRWMGHEAVAVLDGGFAAWCAHGGATRAGTEPVEPRRFTGGPDAAHIATIDDVMALVSVGSRGRLLDARAPERFRGEVEPLDKVAGHIPGAVNHFFRSSLDDSGRFLAPAALRERLGAALGDVPASEVIAYCGSGVTACHNLLAMTHAGLTGARLYPGSWSEWSSDPQRPAATAS